MQEVALRSEVLLALGSTHARDDAPLLAQFRTPDAIILAIDGGQPEQGHDTLSRRRDLQSRRVRVARHLLSRASAEMAALLEEVLALGVAIRGVGSEKQESLGLAMARTLPGVPPQLWQFHSLRAAARPGCDAARTLKKEVRQKVRGGREGERQGAPQPTTTAAVGRAYGLAIRTVRRAAGKSPREPAGLA